MDSSSNSNSNSNSITTSTIPEHSGPMPRASSFHRNRSAGMTVATTRTKAFDQTRSPSRAR
jgi:hypothetical protein